MEIWKDIPGYEGYYQASSYGRIKRIATEFLCKSRWGKNRKIRFAEKMLNTNHVCGSGYNVVSLSKNGVVKRFMVHRIIADVFLQKNNSPENVNHIDGNKNNNNIDNLEWVSRRQNSLHSYHVLGNKKVGQKKVIDTTTGFIYESISDLVRKENLKYSTIARKLAGTLINDTKYKYYEKPYVS